MDPLKDSPGMSRRIRAEAQSPFGRGEIIGRSASMQIRTILEYQEQHYLQKEGVSLRESWLSVAQSFAPYMEKYTPNTWMEMQGLAKGAEIDFDDVLILASVYEKKVGYGADHCSAFAATAGMTVDGSLVCGQTNDESLLEWAAGSLDHVVHHVGDGLEALIYTHPGIPAYMGMNSEGLCILWNYIDNGERGIGVPTNVLIREVLFKKTLSEAVAFLEETPRSIPNNFLLASSREGICNVELFPDKVLKSRQPELAVHANHILDREKRINDVKLLHQEIETTFLRQEALEELCVQNRGRIDISKARSFFSDHSRGWGSLCVHPHVRPYTRARINKTLAAMVFHPDSGTLDIAFGNPCEIPYTSYRFDGFSAERKS